MSKGGMKLMTPGQVSRMPKNDCILFLKGERPIYDKKNWSLDVYKRQHVDTANEALAVSLEENGKVALSFMSGLCGKSAEQITEERCV